MRTSLFIKSHAPDFPWLEFCLRSIRKYCTGFHEVMVAIPKGTSLDPTTERVMPVLEPKGDQYLGQQCFKLYADVYVDSEWIAFCDSDTVFREPCTPEDFMHEGKPIWWCTPWEMVGADARKAWYEPTKAALGGIAPAREFMRRNVLAVPRWMLAAFRDFVHRTHGMSCQDYVMSRKNREFSEFNALGSFLWEFYHEEVFWIDQTEDRPLPRNKVRQFWSWQGINEKDRAELEEICK